jgi:EmrB/QacA subfamily drug resistance transporter
MRNALHHLRPHRRRSPTAADVYPHRWWTLTVLSLSLLIISLDTTIVNVALPTIQKDLSTNSSQSVWIVDAYTLVFAGLLLAAGGLSDRFGRKRYPVFGLLVFGLGSLVSAFSGSADTLIAGRAIMGLGGAFIMPSTLSIVTDVFPQRERSKAIGIWSAMAGAGVGIGPLTGGILLDYFSWGSIFLVNVVVVVAALIAGRYLVPESRDPATRPVDVGGVCLSIATLFVCLWSMIEASSYGWTSPQIVIGFTLAIVLGAAFVLWELRARDPLLDMRWFRNPRFGASTGSIALMFFALYGSIYFMSQYLEEVMGYSALGAGARVMPLAIAMMFCAPMSTRVAARFGTRLTVAFGLATLASGLGLLSTASTTSGYGLVAIAVVLIGSGLGLAMTPCTDAIMASLPQSHAGAGSAVNDAARQVGGSFGVAILGSLLASWYSSGTASHVHDLSAADAATAQNSLSGALQVGSHAGTSGASLIANAQSTFVSAMDWTFYVGTGVAPLALLVSLRLPSRRERRAVAATTAPGATQPVVP